MPNPFKLSERIELVPISQLQANPVNKDIHPDFDPKGRDAWIVDDIAKNGVLMPIITNSEDKILDGHKRVWIVDHCGGKQIPRICLQAGEDRAFASAQLHRELSMHAKCVLYRDRITELVEVGKRKRSLGNAAFVREMGQVSGKCNDALSGSGCDEEPKDEHEESWIELEQVLGKPRKRLAQGVALLARIDEWKGSGDSRLVRRATMASSVFRNRGLAPALRLADESEQAGEDRDDDDVPGRESWPALDKRKRGGGSKKIRKAADDIGPSGAQVLQETELSGDVLARLARPNLHWTVLAFEHVAALRDLLSECGADTSVLDPVSEEIAKHARD